MFFFVLFMAIATQVFAAWWNPVDWVKSGLESGGWTLAAYIATFALGLGIFATVLFVKIVNSMKAAGIFLQVLADALIDRKLTPDEIKAIIADAKAVYDPWKKTPEQYKPEG
jgi:hypothetical protein